MKNADGAVMDMGTIVKFLQTIAAEDAMIGRPTAYGLRPEVSMGRDWN